MDWSKIEQDVHYHTQAMVQQYSHQRPSIGRYDENLGRNREKKPSYRASSPQQSAGLQDANPTPNQDVADLKSIVSKQQLKLNSLEKTVTSSNDANCVAQQALTEKVNEIEDRLRASSTTKVKETADLTIPVKTIASRVKSGLNIRN